MVDADLLLPDGVRRTRAPQLRSATHIEKGPSSTWPIRSNIRQVGYRDWITVRAPNPIEADFFKLPADGRVPMVEIIRERPSTVTASHAVHGDRHPADRNQFIVDVGDVPISNRPGSHHLTSRVAIEHF